MKIFHYKKILFAFVVAIFPVMAGLVFLKPLSSLFIKHAIREKIVRMDSGLDDGLHDVLCGTGNPLPDIERVGPCITVIAGKHLYIVASS